MEVIILWLDNLDDTIFACLLAMNKASGACLSIGFTAAMFLVMGQLSPMSIEWTLIPMGIAALSVGVWSVAALLDLGNV